MRHFQEIKITISVEDYGTGGACGLDAVVAALNSSPSMIGVDLVDWENPVNKVLVDKSD